MYIQTYISKKDENIPIIRKKLEILNEQTLNLAELLMNIVLILIFYPRRKSSDIKINKHEQIIIFLVGILGIIHTKWNDILALFGIKLPEKSSSTSTSTNINDK